MRIYLGMPKIKGPSILCLGIFDGIHLGHRAIINNALRLKEKEISPVIIYTFDKRPAEVLRNADANLLSGHMQKVQLLAKMGVDAVCIDTFDINTAQIGPEEWLAKLCASFHPEHIFTGYNYTFGQMGKGNNQLLSDLQKKYGYKSHVMPEVVNQGQDVSSTRIRNLILQGDIVHANLLLTYQYAFILRFDREDDKRVYFNYVGKNVKPLQGKYAVTLHQSVSGRIMLYSTVLHLTPEEAFINKSNLPNLLFDTKEKVAISFAHRL